MTNFTKVKGKLVEVEIGGVDVELEEYLNGPIIVPNESEVGHAKIITDPSIPAYTGFIANEDYWSGDDGFRMYLMPRSVITSGFAAGFKVFADPYYLDSVNYRDTGLYFSANQAGDTGYHGNGVFYINSKINGSYAAGENHDIAVTFQDGAKQAVKWTYIDGVSPRGISVYGKTNSTTASAVNNVHIEMAGAIGFDNSDSGVRWWGSSGGFSAKIIADVTNGYDEIVSFANSSEIFRASASGLSQGFKMGTRIVERQAKTTSATSINAAGWNSLELSYAIARTLTDITDAESGQRITVLSTNNNATIENNSRLQLKSGANYTLSTGEAIDFVYSGTLGKWCEIGGTA